MGTNMLVSKGAKSFPCRKTTAGFSSGQFKPVQGRPWSHSGQQKWGQGSPGWPKAAQAGPRLAQRSPGRSRAVQAGPRLARPPLQHSRESCNILGTFSGTRPDLARTEKLQKSAQIGLQHPRHFLGTCSGHATSSGHHYEANPSQVQHPRQHPRGCNILGNCATSSGLPRAPNQIWPDLARSGQGLQHPRDLCNFLGTSSGPRPARPTWQSPRPCQACLA